jgi:hypothetical protein
VFNAIGIILAVLFALEPLFNRPLRYAPRRQEAQAPAMSRTMAYVLCVEFTLVGSIVWIWFVCWIWTL